MQKFVLLTKYDDRLMAKIMIYLANYDIFIIQFDTNRAESRLTDTI